MSNIALFLALLPALAGLFLLGDFLYWVFAGRVVRARITGFQDKTDKKMKLPVVEYKNEAGEMRQAPALRIDQLLYILNRPGAGDMVSIVHLRAGPEKIRIYGYINVVAAAALCIPLFAAFAYKTGQAFVLGQTAYVAIMGLIVLGGWVLLKLIQRYY